MGDVNVANVTTRIELLASLWTFLSISKVLVKRATDFFTQLFQTSYFHFTLHIETNKTKNCQASNSNISHTDANIEQVWHVSWAIPVHSALASLLTSSWLNSLLTWALVFSSLHRFLSQGFNNLHFHLDVVFHQDQHMFYYSYHRVSLWRQFSLGCLPLPAFSRTSCVILLQVVLTILQSGLKVSLLQKWNFSCFARHISH